MGIADYLERTAKVIVSSRFGGETVIYRPGGDGGPYPIQARVFREQPEDSIESNRARSLSAVVEVRNEGDTAVGIGSPNVHADLIDVVLKEGSPAVKCRIVEILAQDSAMWRLRVQA